MTDSETQQPTHRSRRVLVAAVASVAVVAVGTTYVVTRGPDRTTPLGAAALVSSADLGSGQSAQRSAAAAAAAADRRGEPGAGRS